MALQVGSNWVPERPASREINGGLNEFLELIVDESMTFDSDQLVGQLIVIDNVRDQSENEFSSRLQGLRVIVPLEPFLALEDSYVGMSLDFNKVIILGDNVEGLSIIGEAAAIEE
jgi:hypothetical protein